MSGPFADHEFVPSNGQRIRREWEVNGNFDDAHGFAGPSDVGRRGRDKERERMKRREKEMQRTNEDEEDWFGNFQNNARSRPSGSGTAKPKDKIVINLKNGDRSDKDKRGPGDSLLKRISSGNPGRTTEQYNRRKDRGRKRSASPVPRRDIDDYRSLDRSRRDRLRASEREPGRDRRRERDRERNSSHRTVGGDAGRSGNSDKKRDEGRSGRQYYGGYTR